MNCSVFKDLTLCSPANSTDVSEEHIAAIFRVEAKGSMKKAAGIVL
jgi:hypothetical protein